jgi:hypothetical protein
MCGDAAHRPVKNMAPETVPFFCLPAICLHGLQHLVAAVKAAA